MISKKISNQCEILIISKAISDQCVIFGISCCIAVIHMQLYTYTCGNIVNTIMTNEHSSLEKYTSHTLFDMAAKGLRKGYV